MLIFSKETIDALARFEAKISELPGTRVHDELILDNPDDAKLVTAALQSAFKQTLPGWVNGRYVGVVK